MNRLIALVCLATACLGSTLPGGKISGGSSVTIEQYPYQISIQLSMEYAEGHMCGASIIGPNWVLTSARCVAGSINYMTFRAGSSTRESGGSVHRVAEAIVHPSYNSASLDYDIAVLRVTPPFVLGPKIRVVALPDENESVSTGASSVVSGWGPTIAGDEYSSQLQAVTVPIMSQSECQKTSPITERMICAGVLQEGKGFCKADTGSPLVSGNKLVGVASRGDSCERPDLPGVYTRVAALRSWISQTSGI